MSSRLSGYIPEQTMLKGLWWSLYFENRKNVFIYKLEFYFFKIFFKPN